MPERTLYKIFKTGSKTYFYNSLFFPGEVREDVFKLYSFVRVADNFVDSVPQKAKEFREFRDAYLSAAEGRPSGDVVIDSFAELSRRRNFDPRWTDAFLASMGMDLVKKTYNDMEEVNQYIYGSAEVIGLFMASIFGMDESAHIHARYLGKAMQYINFIRDIEEDLVLDRTYFPSEDFRRFGLGSLSPQDASSNPDGFRDFVRTQIDRYLEWQAFAEEGFGAIPWRCRIPVKNASDMYKWTAMRIYKNPMLIYEKKVKPSVPRIVATMTANAISSAFPNPRPRKVDVL